VDFPVSLWTFDKQCELVQKGVGTRSHAR